MFNIKLSDFKVGEKCYVEFEGNASRDKPKGYYEEWIIKSVGNKYVTASGYRFEEHECSYGGLRQKTSYCVDYVIYPTEQMLLDKFETEMTYDLIKDKFAGFLRNKELTLNKLRKIKLIIEEGEVE